MEFKKDWNYVITKGRHSLPLVSRMDLERHIVERIFGMSHWTTHLIHGALDSVKYVLANFVKI